MFCRCTIFLGMSLPFLLAGCGPATIEYKIDAALDQTPAIEPLPIAIGVYYPPEFRTYTHVQSFVSLRISIKYPLGAQNVALFDQALAGMFREVVPLKTWPLEATKEVGFSRVIIPEVEHVSVQTRADASEMGPFPAKVTYRISLHMPTGRKVASWPVSGTSEFMLSGAPDFDAQKKKQLALRDSMRNAVANFVIHFDKQPAVKNWLSEQGIVADSDELKPAGGGEAEVTGAPLETG